MLDLTRLQYRSGKHWGVRVKSFCEELIRRCAIQVGTDSGGARKGGPRNREISSSRIVGIGVLERMNWKVER